MVVSKIRIGVVFGGRSGEHEVSVLSARSVIGGLDPDRYEVIPLAITREGKWLAPGGARAALEAGLAEGGTGSLAVLPGGENALMALNGSAAEGGVPRLDVVFPVLHGPYGEDGTIQGLFEMAGIPYVGAGVAGSAVGMDKALMKAVWASHGLPQLDWQVVLRGDLESRRDHVVASLLKRPGLPCFVKPANLGSSVGINRAATPHELETALDHAAEYDRKLVVEESARQPREIEVSVLGNDRPEASVPGEIVHGREFYDYKSKYLNTEGQQVLIPAPLSDELTARIRQLAVQGYRALDLNGLSRVDFFLDPEDRIYLNEVNTMPGFTPVSMYARMWEKSGLSYSALLDRLVEL
ncbi:MAG: D-alanine--D-alanine ligase family protein, partial [Candidatus Eremiobacterota bacterium]